MHTAARYILLVVGVVLSIHYILAFTHEDYGRYTSFGNIASHWRSSPTTIPLDAYIPFEPANPASWSPYYNSSAIHGKRANASFVILARNSDLDSTIRSIREVEERFNRRFNYPYVLLNEVEFTDEFKERISVLTSARVEFGLIPREHWYQPDWIDEDKASKSRDQMVADKIIYGGSLSYRNMCRFNSGFFFKHPLVEKYRWYWRIEPDVHFHCDVAFDPFVWMEENDKKYAFTITMYEFDKTIPTLWGHVKEFMKLHPEHIAKGNAMNFQSDNGGDTYNLCHFWSNFEIADMDFWRSPAYQDFFDYLEAQGGFYYERWGDAPVHSIAANLFLKKEQIVFFDEIGYEHNPYTHCPQKKEAWVRGKCSCDQKKSFDYNGYSCMKRWDRLMGK